jgi:hypothetical protein
MQRVLRLFTRSLLAGVTSRRFAKAAATHRGHRVAMHNVRMLG